MRKLPYYRKRAGMTLKQLAQLSGMKINSIYRYEHGLREPSAVTAAKIAKVLGVTVEELIDDHDDTTAKESA